ncbi:glycine-rich domain-containing protein [Deinococcus wulumuqiensis]|uniref:glycine-rich domain-containing protein n=1 Tax=Deinococcus wulumuqiensis TaxID=980427 RepID=UPI00242D59E3|nr:hypothetical protein [Deinococcus wulumuqiensis]
MTVLYPHEVQPTVSPAPGAAHDPSAVLTYDFPPAMLTRLQREQGWDMVLTLRAVNEYRRFVVLAATAPHPVTPSKLVDEVWHTHVLFTRDYWERLTPLLPAPLHHEPGDGSPADDSHFAGQYGRTLDLYERTFGQPAPADLWPDPRRGDVQAGPAREAAPPLSPLPGWARAIFALVVAAVVTGVGVRLALWPLPAFLLFGLGFLLLWDVLRRVKVRPASRDTSETGIVVLGTVLVFEGWGESDGCNTSGGDSSCSDSGGSSCGSSCGGGGCSS